MNQKSLLLGIAGTVCALSTMLCGCATQVVTHNVPYDLNLCVLRASARETMKAVPPDGGVAVVCNGMVSGSNNIAHVSSYHCENPTTQELYPIPYAPVWVDHILQAPEPIGKYVERAATAALASRGIRQDPQSAKKLVLDLERFDYDETSDQRKGASIFPLLDFGGGDGVVRKGFLNAVLRVVQPDGTISYQRRVSLEVARKRGQADVTAGIASVAIAQLSPVTIDPDVVRKKEEIKVTADVFSDLFAKFQDELVADEDLLVAIRK
jgi:hypothetical protein